MNKGRWVAALALAALATGAPARAQTTSITDKLQLAEHLKSLKFAGDLRVRYDSSFKRGAGTNDRGRLRFRLRFGAEALFPNDLSAVARLASGTGEHSSTNQSLDNAGSQKAIWIDQAYLRWAPKREALSAYAQFGRAPYQFWRPYSTDMIWDDDLNPEGFHEGAQWKHASGGLTLFIHGLQMVVDEDSNSSKNQWLFSQVAGAEAKLPLESRLKLQAGYHKWSDEQRSSFGQTVIHDGNRRTANTTAGLLLNRFGVGEATGQLSRSFGKTPVALQGTVIRNFRARGDLASVAAACPAGVSCTAARDGYSYGLTVGQAKSAKSWEAAYFKRWVQTDATVADVADSDFGDGGVNRKGHIFWLAYAPTGWSVAKIRYFVTETLDPHYAPGDKAINRVQLDFSVKF